MNKNDNSVVSSNEEIILFVKDGKLFSRNPQTGTEKELVTYNKGFLPIILK